MSLQNCYNFDDFRKLAKKKLPSPIFHYIDGGADDEITLKRNTKSFDECDLVPNILASVGKPDLSTTIFGKKIDMPLFLSPCAMQRLYHHDGDKASARAADKFGTFYSMSTMANNTIEEISNISGGPKLFQLYVHKDQGLNDYLIDQCKEHNFDTMAVTVDSSVGGNRERDLYTGFTIPLNLSLKSIISFATHPAWAFNYFTKPKWELSNLNKHVTEGTNLMTSIGDYFTKMLDNSLSWKKIEEAFEKQEKVSGIIKNTVKGGVVVEIFGVFAFCPNSQVADKPIKNMNEYMNKPMEFQIIKIDNVRMNVIASRRQVIEQEKNKVNQEYLLSEIVFKKNINKSHDDILSLILSFSIYIHR